MKKPNFSDYQVKCPCQPQQTDSHCGPTVIQAILATYNITVSQDMVVESARVKSTLEKHGMRPDQLAKVTKKLAPNYQFWFKQMATVTDLDKLIHEYRIPIGVNWQGLFYDTLKEEKIHNPDGDHGHYSIIIDIDAKKDKIVISDPYYEYCDYPRIFSYKWFKTRWHDEDHFVDKTTKLKTILSTKRFIFIIVPKKASFPKKLGFQLPDKLASLHISEVVKTPKRTFFGFRLPF